MSAPSTAEVALSVLRAELADAHREREALERRARAILQAIQALRREHKL